MPGFTVDTELWLAEPITPWDQYWHGVTRVLAHRKTRYQEMYIVETGAYGKALVLDGKWQSSQGDEFLYHEPLVHPAMMTASQRKNILVLGGGEGATVRECLKWRDVEKVVMVDIDGEVVEACKELLPEMHQGAFDNPKTELVIDDALKWLEKDSRKFDVIISDLSDPIEEGPSFKLFTKEFFGKIAGKLAEGGAFVVQAGPVSPAEIKLHARLVNTLRTVFPNVASYYSAVPTYGSPWGFALCTKDRPIPNWNPKEVQRTLDNHTSGEFRMLDGESCRALFALPLYVKRAIESEKIIYTLENPPSIDARG